MIRTQTVREPMASQNQIMPVKLPYQNHAFGDGFRLSATTFLAYSKRSVAPSLIHISGFRLETH